MKGNWNMSVEILKTMILAMVADSTTEYQEVELINTYRNQYPPLADVPSEEVKKEIQRVIVLKQNAVADTYLIEDIGANLSKSEKSPAPLRL